MLAGPHEYMMHYPIDVSGAFHQNGGSRELVSDQFRNVMRRFAATVSIVSVGEGGNWWGMTATSIASVSMDPPALLVCVNRSAAMHAFLGIGTRFCINVLNVGQEALSDAFGGRVAGDKRFATGDWRECGSGLPYLDAAQANVFCTVDALFEYGTHTVFIGKVYYSRFDKNICPLVYLDGKYL